MNYKCTTCGQKFTSQYLLDKHLKRKVPCSLEIKCNRCGKTFTSTIFLNRHLERKNPCTIVNNEIQLQLELEKEKTKQQEVKLKQQEAKIKQQEEKTEQLRISQETRFGVEQLKTDRKEKTSKIINNNFIQNINIEAENYINNQFNASIVYTKSEDKNKALINWYNKLENVMEVENLCRESNNLEELVANIIKHNFNNEYSPNTRFFLYAENFLKFLIASKKSGKYEITEFSEISKVLKNVADTSYDIIKQNIPKSSEIGSKYHDFHIYKNIYNSEKSFEKPAKIGLNPNNKIVKENKYGGAFSDSDDD